MADKSGMEQTIRFDLSLDDKKEAAPGGDSSQDDKNSPTCVIVLGMAGSGKTTFVQRLVSHLHTAKKPPYVVNLDPACAEVPFPGKDNYYCLRSKMIGTFFFQFDVLLPKFFCILRIRTVVNKYFTTSLCFGL